VRKDKQRAEFRSWGLGENEKNSTPNSRRAGCFNLGSFCNAISTYVIHIIFMHTILLLIFADRIFTPIVDVYMRRTRINYTRYTTSFRPITIFLQNSITILRYPFSQEQGMRSHFANSNNNNIIFRHKSIRAHSKTQWRKYMYRLLFYNRFSRNVHDYLIPAKYLE